MLYVKLDAKGNPCEFPITETSLRNRLKGLKVVSAKITPEILELVGYAQVPSSRAPERLANHATLPDVPVRNDQGEIVRTYRYIPYTDEGLEKRKNELRVRRNRMLAATDWTQSSDVQNRMTALQRESWKEYRASLRNMTDDFEDPNIVSFPSRPETLQLKTVNTKSPIAVVRRKIAAKRADIQHAGMPFEFPDGKGTVQTRNEVDIINILGQAVVAMSCSVTGETAGLIPFRDAENVTHDMTPAQLLQMAMAALAFVSDTYAKKWRIEKQFDELVDNGATDEEIMNFDFSTGWENDDDR